MTKLSDTQFVVLNAAANRANGAILPVPKSVKADPARALAGLVKGKLAEAVAAGPQDPVWKTVRSGKLTLRITAKGEQALDTSGEGGNAGRGKQRKSGKEKVAPTKPGKGSASATRTLRENTKQAQVIALLRRPEGATIAQITRATQWQKHTARAVLSHALGKKLGLKIVSDKPERGERVYRIG